ncbi:bifunctional demethylmenaquinone methyltransferase/2-methoxy-6-polyprenyl-1,4-benzoquinol methylase UbiE, partial [Pseudomonas aeruginosa]
MHDDACKNRQNLSSCRTYSVSLEFESRRDNMSNENQKPTSPTEQAQSSDKVSPFLSS